LRLYQWDSFLVVYIRFRGGISIHIIIISMKATNANESESEQFHNFG